MKNAKPTVSTIAFVSRHALKVGATLALVGALGCAHKPDAPVAAPKTVAAAPMPEPVKAPPAAPAPAPAVTRDDDSIFFDFDAAILREDARPELQKLAEQMKARSSLTLRIEGNCDERGTTEYNLALGDQRARSAKAYLVQMGVDAARIQILTYGSERPKATGHDEDAWAKNRRADLVVKN